MADNERIDVVIDTSNVEAGLSKLEARLMQLSVVTQVGFGKLINVEQRIHNLTQTSIQGFDDLNKSLRTINDSLQTMTGAMMIGFRTVNQTISTTGTTTNNTSNSVLGLIGRFKGLLTMVGALVGAFTGLLNIAAAPFMAIQKVLPELWSSFKESTIATQGFMTSINTQFGPGKGPEMFQWLTDASNAMGTSLENNIKPFHQLAASMSSFDKTGELTKDVFSGISAAGAVLQRDQYSVARALEAVQQIMSKNKPSWEELRQQLGDHIPGSVNILVGSLMKSKRYIEDGADTQAKAYTKLSDDIKKGAISSLEVTLRLANGMKEAFGPAIQTPSQLLIGNINYMKNSWTEMMVKISDSSLATTASNIFATIGNIIRTVGENIDKIIGPVNEIGTAFNNFLKSLTVEDIKYFVDIAVTYFTSLWNAVKTAFGGMGNQTRTGLDAFKAFMEGSATFIGGAIDVFHQFYNVVALIFNSIGVVFNAAKATVSGFAYTLMAPINAIIQRMPGVSEATRKSMQSATDSVRQFTYDSVESVGKNTIGAFKNLNDVIQTTVLGNKNATKSVMADWDKVQRKVGDTKIKPLDLKEHLKKNLGVKSEDEIERTLRDNGIDPNAKPDTSKADAKAKKELVTRIEKARKALEALEGQVGKVETAEMKLAKANRDLDAAIKYGLISPERKTELMEQLRKKYEDQLNPMKAILEQYSKETEALKLNGKAYKEFLEVQKARESLKKSNPNMEFTPEMEGQVRDAYRKREQAYADHTTVDKYSKTNTQSDKIDQIQSIGRTSAADRLTKGEASSAAMDVIGADVFAGTDAELESQRKYLEDKQALVDEALKARIISESDATTAIANINNRAFQQSMTNLSNKFTNEFKVAQEFSNLSQELMQSGSKKAFRIGKAMAIASATILGIQSVMQALASGPPPYSFILAGIAGTMAAIQLGKIQAQQPPAFATGGSFTVPGSGGTDNQLVQFMASPGERVSIQTPRQVRHGDNAASIGQSIQASTSKIELHISPELVASVIESGEADDIIIKRLAANRTKVRGVIN